VTSGEFNKYTCDKLVNLLSRYEARVIPTPSKFKTELIQVAKYQFLVKLTPAVISMHDGIITEERNFWASFTLANLYNQYNLLTADPEKLLRITKNLRLQILDK